MSDLLLTAVNAKVHDGIKKGAPVGFFFMQVQTEDAGSNTYHKSWS